MCIYLASYLYPRMIKRNVNGLLNHFTLHSITGKLAFYNNVLTNAILFYLHEVSQSRQDKPYVFNFLFWVDILSVRCTLHKSSWRESINFLIPAYTLDSQKKFTLYLIIYMIFYLKVCDVITNVCII